MAMLLPTWLASLPLPWPRDGLLISLWTVAVSAFLGYTHMQLNAESLWSKYVSQNLCSRPNSNVLTVQVFWLDCSSAHCHCKPVLGNQHFPFLYESNQICPSCPNFLRKLFLTNLLKTTLGLGTPHSQLIAQNTLLWVFSDPTASEFDSPFWLLDLSVISALSIITAFWLASRTLSVFVILLCSYLQDRILWMK